MAVLSIQQVAGAWMGAGGPQSHVVEFVAISMAESSLNDTAVSPVGAEGLWQVMPFWFPDLGLPPNEWSVPSVNARAAVLISGHGGNCAAWDTAYADINASGRFNFLAFPQPGSAAANNIPQVAAALGQHPPVPPPGSPGPTGHYTQSMPRVEAAWNLVGATLTTFSVQYQTSMVLLQSRTKTLGSQYLPPGGSPLG